MDRSMLVEAAVNDVLGYLCEVEEVLIDRPELAHPAGRLQASSLTAGRAEELPAPRQCPQPPSLARDSG